jgi:hypothetical protein
MHVSVFPGRLGDAEMTILHEYLFFMRTTFVGKKVVKGCLKYMTESEIKLAIWGDVALHTKIITKGFKSKELFPCDQM